MLYALQHQGYTISLPADAGWMGEAGPGPSYADKYSVELSNDLTVFRLMEIIVISGMLAIDS